MRRDAVTTVIGRKCVEAEDACGFLSQNGIPHRWVDLDDDPLGDMLAGAVARDRLPLVMFPDGSHLQAPPDANSVPKWRAELALRAGLPVKPVAKHYNLVILGAGPAGLTAALYAASEGLYPLVIDPRGAGGQAATASKIENYPGFPEGVAGHRLMTDIAGQAERLGAELLVGVEATPGGSRAFDGAPVWTLTSGYIVSAKATIIATGVEYRTLEAGGLANLIGKRAFYGSSPSEAKDWRNRRVGIIGGANSAGQAGLHFAKFGARVVLMVRRRLEDRMSTYLVDQIHRNRNIEVREGFDTGAVTEQHAGHLLVQRRGTAGAAVKCDVLYLMIGGVPGTAWLPDYLACDDNGYIETTRGVQTSREGVFAAGDCRAGGIKRVAAAVGDGAAAITEVHAYLNERNE